MAKYMLDTNMCIFLMKNHPEQVARRLAQCGEGDVVVSAVTLAELEYGVSVSANPMASRKALCRLLDKPPVLSWSASAAKAYAPVRAARPKGKADAMDKLIAAHAIDRKVTVVTNNTKDFAYPGLSVEDWTIVTRGHNGAG